MVESAIDYIVNEFQKTRQHRFNDSEDQLTVNAILALRSMGFDAGHDTDYGGHCDIVIDGRDNFLWLGEAKIHSDYNWLLKGFQQLVTRYSTGVPGQNVGGMLIYCRNANVFQIIERWKVHLQASIQGIKIEPLPGNPLVFSSFHIHEVSGLLYRVRHTPIGLHFSPKDSAAETRDQEPLA